MRKVFVTNATIIILLLSLLLLLTTSLPSTQAQAQPQPQPLSGYCGEKCKGRCAKAGMLDRCMRYCGICCEECKCVPSGTYGNKHECPCYRDKTNSKGKPKCP